MGKLIIMSGAPGSGKSTYAKLLVQRNTNTIHISRDAIRFSLLEPGDHYFSRETEVLETFYNNIISYLNKGSNVIADASHLNWKSRKALLEKIVKKVTNFQVEVIYIRPPLKVCFERNDTRIGRENVPHDVIAKMYNSQSDPVNDPYHYDKIAYVRC